MLGFKRIWGIGIAGNVVRRRFFATRNLPRLESQRLIGGVCGSDALSKVSSIHFHMGSSGLSMGAVDQEISIASSKAAQASAYYEDRRFNSL